MIAWLYDKIIGCFCNHKWEIIETNTLSRREGGIPYGQVLVLQCEKCGNIKTKRTV
jgi:hypothetical protein